MRRSAFTLKLAGAGILTLSGLMAVNPAYAATSSSSANPLQHFLDCANWMINDPAKHAKFCDPGTVVFAHGSGGSGAPNEPECPN